MICILNLVCMVVAEDLQCLKTIALMGGYRGQVSISSQALGNRLDISAQTASRRLISLEKQMLITRSVRQDGQYVTITTQGEESLRSEYSDFCRIFEEKKGHYTLEGVLIDGLGEGAYYVSIPGYADQFTHLLNFRPFPGTLNIRLNPTGIETRKKLDSREWIKIEGFQADERTFGSARCLPCTIKDYNCAIIVPGRSHYPEDIIELISPVHIREALHLHAGDIIKVEVRYND